MLGAEESSLEYLIPYCFQGDRARLLTHLEYLIPQRQALTAHFKTMQFSELTETRV